MEATVCSPTLFSALKEAKDPSGRITSCLGQDLGNRSCGLRLWLCTVIIMKITIIIILIIVIGIIMILITINNSSNCNNSNLLFLQLLL